MKTDKNIKTNNKKKTLTTVLVFAALCILGGCLGVFIGYFSGQYESFDLTAIKEIIKNILIYVTPVALLCTFTFVLIYSIFGHNKAKKAILNWDGEDEEYIEKIEAKLGVIISMLTIGLILIYALFAVYFYALFNLMNPEQFFNTLPLMALVFMAFFATIFYNTFMQRACVELVKKINPEKKGDTLSVNFQKEWEQSMDEAQKLMLYETGYRTYKVMNYALMIAWLICTLGIMFGMGLMPTLVVSALWLTSTITYSVYGYKIEHKNKKR